MAKVEYRWSERSEPDLCEMLLLLTKGKELCYHCGKEIPAGSKAVLLLTDRGERFVLHKSCAEKSCEQISEEQA